MYPGELVQIGLQVLDEMGRPTASIVRISEVDVSDYSFLHLIFFVNYFSGTFEMRTHLGPPVGVLIKEVVLCDG